MMHFKILAFNPLRNTEYAFEVNSVSFKMLWYCQFTSPFHSIPIIQLIYNDVSHKKIKVRIPAIQFDVRFFDQKGNEKYQKTLIPVFYDGLFQHVFIDCHNYYMCYEIEITVTKSYHLEIHTIWDLWEGPKDEETELNSYLQWPPEEVVETILEFLK